MSRDASPPWWHPRASSRAADAKAAVAAARAEAPHCIQPLSLTLAFEGSSRQLSAVPPGPHCGLTCGGTAAHRGKRMAYSLAQAAKAVSRDRSTLLRMIKIGKLSATRDEVSGAWVIEPAELHRVYPPVEPPVDLHGEVQRSAQDGAQVYTPVSTPVHMPDPAAQIDAQLAELQARIAEMTEAQRLRDETITDLRHRLDEERADRRQALDRLAAAQERIAALLTDQRIKSERRSDLEPPTHPRRSWWWQRGRH